MSLIEAFGLAGLAASLVASLAEIAWRGRTEQRSEDRGGPDMSEKVTLLTVEFLRWVARAPRSVAEARDAWRSTCPTTSAWEDAIAAGLIAFDGATRIGGATLIVLTARGRAVLDHAERG
jgi:hypothetical protein